MQYFKGLMRNVMDSLLEVEQKLNKCLNSLLQKWDTLFFSQESTIDFNSEELKIEKLTKVATINYDPVTEYYPLIGDDGSIKCIPVTEL